VAKSSLTQPRIDRFSRNLVCWCIMGHSAEPTPSLMPRKTGGEGGLKWQCSAPLISNFSNYYYCYHLCAAAERSGYCFRWLSYVCLCTCPRKS